MRTTQNPKQDAPYASVAQVERNKWRINVIDGDYTSFAIPAGTWYRRSKASAERKAVRELKRYNRKFGNLDSGFVVQ